MVTRRACAVLAVLTALAALVVVPTAQAAEHTMIQGSVTSVPEPGTDEPVEITFTIYKPANAGPDSPVPVVLHSHGWGGSRTNSEGAFDDFNDAGLAVLSFDQRGFGESGGQAHIEHPDYEARDVEAIVDHLAGLDWVAQDAPGDPRIAAIGGSYGGGYQFAGAFGELLHHGTTRFDALAPEITWWDLGEMLAPSGVVRTTWVTALYALGAGALPQEVHEAFAYGAATGQWPDGTVYGEEVEGVDAPDIAAFFEKNGPKWHVANGRRLDIPVLFRQGTSDNLVNLNHAVKNFEQALTPAAQEQSILVGYNGGHALPNVLPLGTFEDVIGVGQDTCSPGLTSDGTGDFRRLSIEFFTRVFNGADPRPDGVAPYHITPSGNGECLRLHSIDQLQQVALDLPVATPLAASPAINVPVVEGPITVAGIPAVDASLTSLGADARAFLGLAVGTTPADARVVQNNLMPVAQFLPVAGEARTIELAGVAVEVPEGQSLFLTVTGWSDMYYGHGSRAPGALLLEDVVVHLPVVG